MPNRLFRPTALLCAFALTTAVTLALGAMQQAQPDALPDIPNKPKPQSSIFNDCPPEGKGGDPLLNRLKNREDSAATWYPVSFQAIAELP